MSEVSEALKASRALHNQAKGQGGKRPENWKDLLTEARALRLQANRQNPDRKDRAWVEDQDATPRQVDTNAVMLRFYAEVLDR